MIRILFVFLVGICSIMSNTAYGCEYHVKHGKWVNFVISKSHLNRISNYPYKIVQVVGNDSHFRVKYDDDGSSIYITPLVPSGSIIDLSISNDIGITYDLQVAVSSDKKAISVLLDSICTKKKVDKEECHIVEMLRAMRDGVNSIFYVQKTDLDFTKEFFIEPITNISITQTKLYKYKNLQGAVFAVRNKSRKTVDINLLTFPKQFTCKLSLCRRVSAADEACSKRADKNSYPPEVERGISMHMFKNKLQAINNFLKSRFGNSAGAKSNICLSS